MAVGQERAAGQQHVAFAKVDAGGADMPSGDRGFGDGDGAAIDDGIFLDDDGVGAIGDHAAGEDPDRFAGADRSFERTARRDLADHLQPRGGIGRIGRADRIAVHRRHRLRRLGAQGRDVARQHPVIGGIERDHFFRQRLGACENRPQRVGNRHQGHGKTSKANLLNSERGERVGDIPGRRHVNADQAARPRALDIRGESRRRTRYDQRARRSL